MLDWIKALQEVLCEVMNQKCFGSEDQEFFTLWLTDVNDQWMKDNCPAMAR